MTTAEQLREIRASTGLTQAAFAARYEIPLRSYEDWEAGRRVPPIYLLHMLSVLVEHGLDLS